MKNETTLDARRLLCPMPVIKTQNAIKLLSAGDVLLVSATDPGVKHDIPAWCRINGHKVLNIEETNNELLIRIEVGDS